MTASTIALALMGWTVLGLGLALLIGRAIPRSPEPDEHESGHIHAEFDGRVAAQVRAVDDFHNRSTKTNLEQDHA